MEKNIELPYQFSQKEFRYNGCAYKVVLTPELYKEEGGLDFTGNYCVVLISELKGTMMFELNVDSSKKWESEPKGIDPGIIDILSDFIQEIRKN